MILFWVSVTIVCHAQKLTALKEAEGVWVKENEEKVLFYQTSPKSIDGKYTRANYIHPLYNIDGFELTENFPRDHLHHRGIFWTWHQVLIKGKPIGDAWECKDFSWEVEHVKHDYDGDKLNLQSEVLWKSPEWIDGDKDQMPFMKESVTITVHAKEEFYRIVDFEIALLALESEVSIGGSDNAKGYGGFSARLKTPKNIHFASHNGEVKPITNQLDEGQWVNISGMYAKDGGPGGVIIICHQENPMFPENWILREKGSMQNPVFPGRDPVSVSTETPTVLKYRLVMYTGEMSDKEIDAQLSW